MSIYKGEPKCLRCESERLQVFREQRDKGVLKSLLVMCLDCLNFQKETYELTEVSKID